MNPTTSTDNDDDRDFLQERAERLRYLDHDKAHAETADPPVIKVQDQQRRFAYVFASVIACLSILLSGIVIGHLVWLPDATIWPMIIAALILAGGASYILYCVRDRS